MKGIILAGGNGTRLYPATSGISKQLIPIYNKPMIYYSLTVLMLAGLREIALISTPHDIDSYRRLLGDGNQWGIELSYIVQPSPDGLAQSFILAEDFLNGHSASLILGDNLYYGHGLVDLLLSARNRVESLGGANVFGYWVADPQRYGVVEFNERQKVISIEEKPKVPKSNYAVTGLYFYDDNVCHLAKEVRPSDRGEIEITALNNLYLLMDCLNVNLLGRGYAWFDAGTHDSLMEASQFIATVENRQGLIVGSPEEIAYNSGWINKEELHRLACKYSNRYGSYLLSVLER